MKNADLTPLKNNDVEFQEMAKTISDRFKCSWNDSVHDSYVSYVSHMQDNAREIQAIRCKAESLLAEAENLKIDTLKNMADQLCTEAETI